MYHITVRYKHDKAGTAFHFWTPDWYGVCNFTDRYNPVGRKLENRQWVIRHEEVADSDLTPRILETGE